MEIDLKAEIKKNQEILTALQGRLTQQQQVLGQVSSQVVMRQGIIAYLQQMDGQEEGRKALQNIINQSDTLSLDQPPTPPPPSEPEPPAAT